MLKRFDTDLSSLADRFVTVDSVVWDIGANCGVFSFSCAAAQQIIAVEADPFLLSLLQESNRINNDIINIVSAAVFEDTKLVGFSIAHRGRASNHLSNIGGNSQSGGERSRLYVQTIALDSLLNSFLPPTLIKIDVEGAEVSVLKGSHKLLNIIKPIIYLETNENTHEDCRHILELAGYRLSREKDMNWLCTFIE